MFSTMLDGALLAQLHYFIALLERRVLHSRDSTLVQEVLFVSFILQPLLSLVDGQILIPKQILVIFNREPGFKCVLHEVDCFRVLLQRVVHFAYL